MVNRTGQGQGIVKSNRTMPVSGNAPRVQYSTTSGNGETGAGFQSLGQTLGDMASRQEDRLDLIAHIEAGREGTIAGRDGLPERQDDSTIRGRAFNLAARDTMLVQTDARARKALMEYEDGHQADPAAFRAKADEWLQGALPALQRFDPKMALQIESDFNERSIAAENRIKDRQLAIARDAQSAETFSYQLSLQDEIAADASNLFNNGPIETQKTLQRLMSSAGKLAETANMIGPDGRPLFSGRDRVLLARQARQGVAEQVAMSWLRTQGNMAQGIEDLQNGTAAFDITDGPRADGKITRVALQDVLGADVLAAVLPDVTDKGLREMSQANTLQAARTEEARSTYELKIAAASTPEALESLGYEIDRRIDDVGGVVAANDLKKKIITKNADYRAKLDSVARGSAFASGGAYLNPGDATSVKDYNNFYEASILPKIKDMDQATRNTLLTNLIDRARVVPDAIKGDITAAARSRRPEEVLAAADLIDRVRSVNPNMLSDFPSKEMARIEMVRSNMDAGYSEQEAFERADKTLDPANEASLKIRREELKSAKINYQDYAVDAVNPNFLIRGLPLIGAPGVNPNEPMATKSQTVQLSVDYQRAYESHYEQTGNADLAKKHADSFIQGIYSVTAINGKNKLMKYAPENYYGISGVDHDWMREQVIAEARKITSADFSSMPSDFNVKEDVLIVPDPYVTPRTAKQGQPVYKLMYVSREDGALRDLLGPNKFFQFDPGQKRASIVKEARKAAENAGD